MLSSPVHPDRGIAVVRWLLASGGTPRLAYQLAGRKSQSLKLLFENTFEARGLRRTPWTSSLITSTRWAGFLQETAADYCRRKLSVQSMEAAAEAAALTSMINEFSALRPILQDVLREKILKEWARGFDRTEVELNAAPRCWTKPTPSRSRCACPASKPFWMITLLRPRELQHRGLLTRRLEAGRVRSHVEEVGL